MRSGGMSGLFKISAVPLLLLALSSCGGGEEGDPAAIDAHLNQLIKNDEADRRRRVLEARQREAVREREMEANAANYSGD